ncbi:hypothetical protein FACS1894125_5280 [Actinomycetota bacterium]|nr:hypothetical protein FACS1894125_5280 [Actinomycetota bacterium]
MKYYIYARKSTDVEDKQVQSIDAQLVELRKYAREHNLEIVDELIEKRTAKKPGRPIFNKMIENLQRGVAEGVISWAPDRISRNPVDSGTISWMLSTGEIKDIQFVTQPFINDPTGKFLLNLGFAQGQQYIENLAINTKRGLNHRARTGWAPTKAPLGYKNDPRTKTIEVDTRLAPVITGMFELYSEGQTTLIQLSDWLYDRKLKTRTGKRLSPDAVKFILKNIFYTGLFKYSGDIYEGKHTPIVSCELFDKAQKVIRSRSYNRS